MLDANQAREMSKTNFSALENDLELNNALSDWKILHTPGHTKGSVCYYNKKD